MCGCLLSGTEDVENAGGGKRVARASSRGALSVKKAAAQIAAAWDEFGFLPPELVSACGLLVQRYHAHQAQPGDSVVKTVWLSDADELLRHHRALKILFGRACRTRRVKPAKERQETVAALILACETLVQDEAGWGRRFPEAKQKAEQLLAKVSKRRAWLIDRYGYPASEG